MPCMIEAENLVFVYPDGSEALRDVNLFVREGERVAIVGPNGAGKTTLLLLLAGLRNATSGEVRICGDRIDSRSSFRARSQIGIVFQDPDDQIFLPTVEEDIAFGPTNMALPSEEIDARVRGALEAMGLSGFEKRAPHHLSAGEKKRVAIAGVLAMSPRLLLLDEPTSGLDPRGKKDIMSLLAGLTSSMLLVTHDMDLALGFSDRIVLLRRTILFDGKPAELFARSDLVEAADLAPPKMAEVALLLRERGIIGPNDNPRTVEDLRKILTG